VDWKVLESPSCCPTYHFINVAARGLGGGLVETELVRDDFWCETGDSCEPVSDCAFGAVPFVWVRFAEVDHGDA